MIEIGLIFARFLHYAATTVLAGLSFFPLYAYVDREPEALGQWRRKWFVWTAVAAFVSGLCWFAFTAANMSGDISDLADAETLEAVAGGTSFGILWTLRMLLTALIVGVAAWNLRTRKTAQHRNLMTSLLAGLLLVSLAGTGHAQIEEGWAGAIHVIADGGHLLAAGAWLGGLIPLAVILHHSATTGGESKEVDQILLRFSAMGYVAVATLIGSGLINGWFLVGSLSGLLHTTYGQILVGKLALFGGMLVLAAANRFWLVPAMGRGTTNGSDGSAIWSARLRTHVLGELLLGWAVILAVSILGTMQPAVGQ
jgi:putative copper resistance protein D